MSDPTPSAPGKTSAVVALAALVRLVYILTSTDDPAAFQPLVDARTYHDLAVQLGRSGIFDEQFLWQGTFYPLFLATIYKVFGVSLWAAKLVQVVVAAVTCWLTVRLGETVADRRTGLLAGMVVALYGPLVFFDVQLLATGWAALWLVLITLLAIRQQQRPRPFEAVLLGVAAAAAVLTRPTFLPVLVLIPLWWLWRGRCVTRGTYLRSALASAVALAVVLGLYGGTVHRQTGHWGILPPSGGINLFIGNNPEFERTINIRPGLGWEELLAEPQAEGLAGDPWSGQGHFVGKVRRFAADRPGEFLGLLGQKSLHLLTSRELPRTLDIYLHREYSPVLQALLFKVGNWGFPFGLLLPLAVAGAILGRKQLPGLLVLIPAVHGAAVVLVFVAARYRAPLVPVLAVLAAHGLWQLTDRFALRRGRTLAAALVIMVPVLLVSTRPGPFAQERIDLRGEVQFGVGWNHYRDQDWSRAVQHLRQAVVLNPDLPAAHNYLGIALVNLDDPVAALDHFRAAVRLRPGYGEAERNLERCEPLAARRLYRRGRGLELEDPSVALDTYRQVRTLDPAWPEPLARMAWILATTAVDSLRDGPAALALLEDDLVRSGRSDPYVMHIEAAALAACGRFAEARDLAAEALELCRDTDRTELKMRLEDAVKTYARNRPLQF